MVAPDVEIEDGKGKIFIPEFRICNKMFGMKIEQLIRQKDEGELRDLREEMF